MDSEKNRMDDQYEKKGNQRRDPFILLLISPDFPTRFPSLALLSPVLPLFDAPVDDYDAPDETPVTFTTSTLLILLDVLHPLN